MSARHTAIAVIVGIAGCSGTLSQGTSPDAAAPDAQVAGSPDAAIPDGGSPMAGLEVAPYFYTWGWGSSTYAFPSLASMRSMGGPREVTIAFVLADNGCKATHDVQDNLADVNAFIAAGGHVKASFGGADGTYLESACTDADSLAAAMTDWITATGVTDLDFDIEQGAATSNATINARRAAALAKVQAAKGIRVAFTLPVNPDGLDDLGKAVVQSALDAGVKVSYVNVMTMDYGSGAGELGTVSIGSSDATAHQLTQMIGGLALGDAYKMVGATPMIGKNDDGNVFSLDDATALAAWAKQHELGLLAFWAIQRDETCAGAVDLDQCSGANTATFQFANIFASAI